MSIVPYGRNVYQKDIDGKTVVRVVRGKDLESLFNMVNSAGFLDGETYDGFLCEENPISGFKTFHFFSQGSEIFQVILGFNSSLDIGAIKIDPPDDIKRFFFAQGLTLGSLPAGSLMGLLFAIGGSNVVFTLLTNPNGYFALENNNQLVSTTPIPEGEYKMFVQAVAQGGSQYVDEVTLIIAPTALITNISISNILIEDGAPIGTIVGELSTQGGEPPITYTIASQLIGETPVDVFELDGATLQTKSPVGPDGTAYRVFISAEESRTALPDDERIKVEEFEIDVVASSFLNSNSLGFNGVDERVDVPADISLWGNQNFSASAWIKPNSIGASQYVVSKFREAGNRSWALRINTAGTIAVVYSQTGLVSDTTTSVGSVAFGSWSHIAFSFDGTLGVPKMKIWINGVLQADETTLLTSLYNNTTVEMFIGALNQPLPTVASNYFDGLMDEVSVYNISLDQTQVSEIYNSGAPRNLKAVTSSAGLVSWYRMGDDFSGSVQPDSEGSNDGTGVNMNNSNRSTDVP